MQHAGSMGAVYFGTVVLPFKKKTFKVRPITDDDGFDPAACNMYLAACLPHACGCGDGYPKVYPVQTYYIRYDIFDIYFFFFFFLSL